MNITIKQMNSNSEIESFFIHFLHCTADLMNRNEPNEYFLIRGKKRSNRKNERKMYKK